MKTTIQGNHKAKKTGFFHEIKKNWELYLMFMPAAIYFFLFSYVPMPGIVVAFKNLDFAKGIFKSPWCGIDNFQYFFKSGKLLSVTFNTVFFNILFIVTGTAVSIFAAILISEMSGAFFKKAAQSMMFLPHFISWVIASAIVYNFFNYEVGMLNGMLTSWGLERVDIYSHPNWWPALLSGLNIWKGVGYSSVLYLAAIMGIDKESYEAAKIDGANRFQCINHITLPALKPTIITLGLLSLSNIMRGNFDMFFQLVGNNIKILEKTDIIDTFVFRMLTQKADYGMSSAAAFYQSVLCLAFIYGVNAIVKKVSPDNSLF